MININKMVVFDLETTGQYASLLELHENDRAMSAQWSKRCEFLRSRYPENAQMDDHELYLQKAGLHGEFLRIVCASFGIVNIRGEIVVRSTCSADEKEVLNFCDRMLANGAQLGLSLAGHNIERFDVPVLWKRFLANGMKPPSMITTYGKKPWETTFFDTAKFWSGGAWQESFASLESLCGVFGVMTPKDGLIASGVHEAFWSGDLDGIQTYCDKDVNATVQCIIQMTNPYRNE